MDGSRDRSSPEPPGPDWRSCTLTLDVPLFHTSDDKIAKQATAQAEFDRLNALSPADLALEVMPAFGPDGPHGHGPNGGINILQALLWLNEAHFPSGISYISKLQEPVREAIQALDHAGLVLTSAGPQGAWTSATRLATRLTRRRHPEPARRWDHRHGTPPGAVRRLIPSGDAFAVVDGSTTPPPPAS